MTTDVLKTEIQYLKGVGPSRAALLRSDLNINTFSDLLFYFPYKYLDRSSYCHVNEINSSGGFVQVVGTIIGLELMGVRPRQRLRALFADQTGIVDLVWFKGLHYMVQNLKQGETYIIYGKPSLFNGKINMVHPEIERLEKKEQKIGLALQPYYVTSEKMKNQFLNSKAIHGLIGELFQHISVRNLEETLPVQILEQYKMVSKFEAMFNIHFPQNQELLKKAEFRLKFEELFYIQIDRVGERVNRQKFSQGYTFSVVGESFNHFYHKNLKFELTTAQKKVIREIRKDLGSGRQMNRLLQGDVGSGKTLVALMAMLIAIDNGFQACLMAPTEILARQHLETLSRQLEGMGLEVALLTGSVKGKKRKEILQKLQEGQISILIGTHALIEDQVVFLKPGLVVIDEQHRFGVAQRAKLWNRNNIKPHVLVMTATPIPRTLAMTLYGDLDVSILDELPPGRKPIQTMHYLESGKLKVHDLMQTEIAKGRQVYVVFPLIKESEKMDYKNLEEGYKNLIKLFPEPKYQLAMVHGKLKNDEKEKAMQLFVEQKAQILVATTVIEVGVNVPNASVMVIESAERFGLAQLHQLRGRVGRGADQSFCILVSSPRLSADGRRRMQILTQTTDGFIIAEEDLRMRGQGDLEGTQQSGEPISLSIASLSKDGQILQLARDAAEAIFNADPHLQLPEHALLNKTIEAMRKNRTNWRLIG